MNTYIIGADGGPYKIGKSDNVRQRLKSIQTGAYQTLSIVAVYPSDVESALHERFSAKRVRGEWFDLSNVDIAEIQEDCPPFGDHQVAPCDRSTKRDKRGRVSEKTQRRNQEWMRLVAKEPRLAQLLIDAKSHNDDDPHFCANAVWHGYGKFREQGLKEQLKNLVGRRVKYDPDLGTRQAYDIAFETVYGALPGCRACYCASLDFY